MVPRLADLGYRDVWSAEVDGADGFTPLSVAALREPRLDLGVAVTPVFTRGAGLLAMSVAAMAEVSEGRVTMGLGASSQPVVERWNGIAYDRPYARTRDMLDFLKRALAGEKIDEVFETFEVHGFKLSRPVVHRPPILLGALRPGMLRWPERRRTARSSTGSARATSPGAGRGRRGQDDRGATLRRPLRGRRAARFIARRMISSYLTVNAYAEFHRWLGRADVLGADVGGVGRGRSQARPTRPSPTQVVDELIIHGPFEECREHVARYVEAGVEPPCSPSCPSASRSLRRSRGSRRARPSRASRNSRTSANFSRAAAWRGSGCTGSARRARRTPSGRGARRSGGAPRRARRRCARRGPSGTSTRGACPRSSRAPRGSGWPGRSRCAERSRRST